MDSPLLWFEGVEGFVCSTAASPVAIDKHAAAAIVALPIRNRRRDEEKWSDVTAGSSGEARLVMDIAHLLSIRDDEQCRPAFSVSLVG
jgi:hypothetical protein